MKDNLLVPTDRQLKENQDLRERIARLNTEGFFTTRLEKKAEGKGDIAQDREDGENTKELVYDGRGVA